MVSEVTGSAKKSYPMKLLHLPVTCMLILNTRQYSSNGTNIEEKYPWFCHPLQAETSHLLTKRWIKQQGKQCFCGHVTLHSIQTFNGMRRHALPGMQQLPAKARPRMGAGLVVAAQQAPLDGQLVPQRREAAALQRRRERVEPGALQRVQVQPARDRGQQQWPCLRRHLGP